MAAQEDPKRSAADAAAATSDAATAAAGQPSSGGKEDGKAAPGSAQPLRRIDLKTLFMALLGAWVGVQAMLIAVARLWGVELLVSILVGMAFGVGLSLIYFLNQKKKAERSSKLGSTVGVKGMQEVLHTIPTWISFRETEKVEWLNAMLEKAWPYYDEAICATIKAQVEPLMEMYKPPGIIKKIYFQKLTFGDDPFRVEGIKVDRSHPDEVTLEVSFRWAGDANIFLAIDVTAGGTMVPKVSDFAVSGVLRVVLKPLLNEIPGFGAAIVSLMRPPVVRFKLNFGSALGGSYTAGAVKAWLDPFLRETVTGMVVWPKRIVVPILPPEVTGPLDDLMFMHRGVLQVEVEEARNIPAMDAITMASDPFVEAYTMPEVVERTETKKNTLTPVWKHRMWLMVQEPDTQILRLTMYDVDTVNVKELMRLNVLKGAASVFGSKTVMGRCMIRVAVAAERPGKTLDRWWPLGVTEFADAEESCGTGRGELRLRLTYWPFELMSGHNEAGMGAVLITLIKANHLAIMDRPLRSSDPYVRFKLNGEVRESTIKYRCLDPEWDKERFDWFKVPVDEVLSIKVKDYDQFTADEVLGELEIDIGQEIAAAPGGDVTKTWALEDVPEDLFGGDPRPSTITLRIQWIPFK